MTVECIKRGICAKIPNLKVESFQLLEFGFFLHLPLLIQFYLPNLTSLSLPTTKIQKAIPNNENGVVWAHFGLVRVTQGRLNAYEFLLVFSFHSNYVLFCTVSKI